MTQAARFLQEIGRLVSGYQQPVETPSKVPDLPATYDMVPLVAYRRDWPKQTARLCKYLSEDDEQAAFNAVAASLYDEPPMVLPMGFMREYEFTVIRPKIDPLDPLGQAGYIGIKSKTAKEPA